MSTNWHGAELGREIERICPGAVTATDAEAVWLDAAKVAEVCQKLKDAPDLGFDLLVSLTAVDYAEYFEVVYRLRSLLHNSTAVLKAKVGMGRTDPQVGSVYHIWRGADLMEREAWDLMGVKFNGHPNLKRIMLWDGFPGHPLRKDFLTYSQSVVEEK